MLFKAILIDSLIILIIIVVLVFLNSHWFNCHILNQHGIPKHYDKDIDSDLSSYCKYCGKKIHYSYSNKTWENWGE